MKTKELLKYFFEKKFFFFVLIIFFFVSCKENKEIEKVHIHRFEQALFSANKSKDIDKYLFSIEKEYEPMFATSLQNKEYLDVVKEFIKDKEMNTAYNIVKIQYPDLTELEQELSFVQNQPYAILHFPKIYCIIQLFILSLHTSKILNKES